jgi:tetraacyldisaccharide 4'-kinase
MNSAVTLALTPLSSLYGLAMKARRALYESGRFQVHQLGVPVISVGNLTTGGTGKTPLVEWIARELARSGRRVCILTRGYGRQNADSRVVVSDGNEIVGDANQAGDEPLLLAERLQGLASVIADADRVSAAHWAIQNLKTEVFVLDDGFQHLRVARDLNILTVDAGNPWGNGRVLPAGTLRESPTELARADCIVITRIDEPNAIEQLQARITSQNTCPVFSSRMQFNGLRPLQSGQTSVEAADLRALKTSAFCGLGNPSSFFSLLEQSGYNVVDRQVFRDHHRYTQPDIDRIIHEAVARKAQVLLTTAKDEVKLRRFSFELPCFVVDMEIEIENHEKFKKLIADAATTARAV